MWGDYSSTGKNTIDLIELEDLDFDQVASPTSSDHAISRVGWTLKEKTCSVMLVQREESKAFVINNYSFRRGGIECQRHPGWYISMIDFLYICYEPVCYS